ncbi:MAG: signal peptidase I [Nitrospirae bacterium]|uniref:Signal peptidase I n=1 Tax=Leptospirillum ferrodiazotrophum TaxID=412449 RepID=C6I0S3_9BACT|nr:MAG: signal peptidase I [Leptospirillum ferrodiazotrophum]MCL5953979.1 signal peptidase I [Nitrospirota bacterium]
MSEPSQPPSSRETSAPKKKSLARELTEGLLTAFVIAAFLKLFVIQAFRIPSGSMIPTLLIGDQILVSKLSYGVKNPFHDRYLFRTGHPHRGDVVVFKWPKDETKDFIKRVIGIPGDHIQIIKKKLYVNGVLQNEPYIQSIDPETTDQTPRDNFDTIVPPHSYFVMGDNRDDSYDSRFWGFVKSRKIVGRAILIYWSWDKEHDAIRLARLGRIIH